MSCTICKDAISENCLPVLTTPCGHLSHKECLEKWLSLGLNKIRGRCPHCRQRFNISECTRLFPVFYPREIPQGESSPGFTDYERTMQYLDLEKIEDPQMSKFNSIVHFVFTCLLVKHYINATCRYGALKSLLDEELLDDEEDIEEQSDIVTLGYYWVYTMIICSVISVLFGFWAEYMNQTRINGYGRYLRICLVPSRHGFRFFNIPDLIRKMKRQ